MRNRSAAWMAAIAGVFLMTAAATVQEVSRPPVEGIRNFARLGTTVACAGATSADALAEIRKMGFVSVINLRLASEPGAEVEKEEAAAKALGLRYVHVPFDGKPNPAAADAFIAAITAPGAEPAFIHCAGGNRAATMWLIKRLVVDGWEVDRAVKEATALGQTSEALRTWAIDYAATRRRPPRRPTTSGPSSGGWTSRSTRPRSRGSRRSATAGREPNGIARQWTGSRRSSGPMDARPAASPTIRPRPSRPPRAPGRGAGRGAAARGVADGAAAPPNRVPRQRAHRTIRCGAERAARASAGPPA